MSVIIKNLEKFYDYLLNSKTVLGSLTTLFLFLYGGLAGSKLPKKFKDLFNNFIFRLLVIILVANQSTKNFKISILISICFLISISLFDDSFLKESFMKIDKMESDRKFIMESFAEDDENSESTNIEETSEEENIKLEPKIEPSLNNIDLSKNDSEIKLSDGLKKLDDIISSAQTDDNIQNMYELYSISGNESMTLKKFREAYFNKEKWVDEWKLKSKQKLELTRMS